MAAKVNEAPTLRGITVAALAQALTPILAAFGYRINRSVPLDGTEPMTGPLGLAQYATGSLPAAASYEGHIVYDSTTNTVKFSNGTTWTSM